MTARGMLCATVRAMLGQPCVVEIHGSVAREFSARGKSFTGFDVRDADDARAKLIGLMKRRGIDVRPKQVVVQVSK